MRRRRADECVCSRACRGDGVEATPSRRRVCVRASVASRRWRGCDARRRPRAVDVCTMRSSLPAGSEPGGSCCGLEASPRANSSAEMVRGVYPVMRKWHRGVGTSDATKPTRSLFVYPGYLKVVVEAAMTVLTRELTWCTLGFGIRSRSTAILFNAVLSKTTTQSAFTANLLRVKIELYGWTTTSD